MKMTKDRKDEMYIRAYIPHSLPTKKRRRDCTLSSFLLPELDY